MSNSKKYSDFLIKAGYWVVLGGLIFLFAKFLIGPLVPFIIAFAVSTIVQPMASRLSEKLRMKKSALSIIFALLIYLLLAAIVVGILVGAISALVSWAEKMPSFFADTMTPWFVDIGNRLMALVERFAPELTTTVDELLPDAVSTVGSSVLNFSAKIVTWVSSVGSKLPGILLATVICVISTAFLAGDFENVTNSAMNILSESGRRVVEKAREAFRTIIGNYAKSYSLILLITFAELCVGLLIIGVESAPLIALIIAVFDILPIVGSGMVLLPWTIITFIQGNILRGIGLGIIYIIVIIARQIFEPKIVGRQVGLHPLLTLLCMWVGLKLAGGIGMFACPIALLIIRELKADGVIGKDRQETAEITPETNAPELEQTVIEGENTVK